MESGPLRFNELDPAQLRKILDESGIKRRVIVISACYSGDFIDKLEDANSLIITAAAPDKNSFGCNNTNEFTYFGKAYFDEALRRTSSFITALEMARPAIAEREKKQGYKSSDPMMFVGDKIRGPLARMEAQWKSAPAVAGGDGK